MNEDELIKRIEGAKKRILILGINPLHKYFPVMANLFAHLLNIHQDFVVEIYYESANENFNQSTSFGLCEEPTRFSYLETHRKRISGQSKNDSGFKQEIFKHLDSKEAENSIDDRIIIQQYNLKLPANILLIDDELYICQCFSCMPELKDYDEFSQEHKLYKRTLAFLNQSVWSDAAKKYLSVVDEELIWAYDKESYPRGVYPRKSFYTTQYGRYVVWVFVFNRKGELLLQRRSMKTKDNRGLWDKSVGGHVDLKDASTSITARRELIEETYLSDDEFTEHVKADLGDVVDFGELNFRKRPERFLKGELKNIGKSDWAMFRAVDHRGKPLKVKRTSERILSISDTQKITKRTVFHADIFLMMAPKGEFDNADEINKELPTGDLSAVSERKLLSIPMLNNWIEDVSDKGIEKDTFTDDLLFINTEYPETLEEFSEFIKFIEYND